jgi:hypothetical protein
MTRVPVQRQSDKYWRFGKEQLQALVDDTRAPVRGAAVAQTLGDTYFAEDHALERLITDEERAISTPRRRAVGGRNPDRQAAVAQAKALRRQGHRHRAGHTEHHASGTAQWSDYTNSKPTEDIQAGQEAIAKNSGVRANTLVLGFSVFSKLLRNHPRIVERVQNIRVGVVRRKTWRRCSTSSRCWCRRRWSGGRRHGRLRLRQARGALLRSPTPAFGEPSFGKSFVGGAPLDLGVHR